MLTDIALIIFVALVGNLVLSKLGLPGILGMIIGGVVLGPSGLDLIDPEVLVLLKEFKTVALIVILIRAGLGINRETLNRIGGPAIRMGFVPCIAEGVAVTAASYYSAGSPVLRSRNAGLHHCRRFPGCRGPSDARTQGKRLR